MTKNGIWGMALALVALAMPVAAGAASVAKVLTFGGTLRTTSGAAETTYQNITFRLYDVSEGGTALFDETLGVQPGTDGTFSVKIGSTKPLDAALFAQQLYLGIQVQGEAEMVPRTQLTPTPYSWSVDWSSLKGFPAACPPGQFVSGVGPALACAAPPQAVAAVVGSGVIDATAVDGTVTVALASTGCVIGQVLKFGALGWGCGADVDTDTGLTAVSRDASLAGNGTAGSPLGLMSCAEGQILKRSSGAWSCDADVDTDTGLTTVSRDASLVGDGTGASPLGVAFPVADPTGKEGAATTAARSDHRHAFGEHLGTPFVQGGVSFDPISIAGVEVGGTNLLPGSSASWSWQLDPGPGGVPTVVHVAITSVFRDNGLGVAVPPPFSFEALVIRPGELVPCVLPAPAPFFNPSGNPPYQAGMSVLVKASFTDFGSCSLTDDATLVVRLLTPPGGSAPAPIIEGLIKFIY